jgi:hypothetical protein
MMDCSSSLYRRRSFAEREVENDRLSHYAATELMITGAPLRLTERTRGYITKPAACDGWLTGPLFKLAIGRDSANTGYRG